MDLIENELSEIILNLENISFNKNIDNNFEKNIIKYNEKYDLNNINNIKNINNIYFDILVEKIRKKKIYIKCNCNNVSYFLPYEKCNSGNYHNLYLKPENLLQKSILFYSENDFINKKPYYVI
jgi:hypothetical protein